jgi:hypothetical protein
MPPAAIATHWYTLAVAGIALFGVLATLLINGIRAERQRRRDLHARALAAIIAYGEMPYRIRRRATGTENRARLSDELSLIKAEVDTCQVLLAADGDEKLSEAFDDLYKLARTRVGKEAHDAWIAPVIDTDQEMNQGLLYRRLADFNAKRAEFADDLRTATLPRHKLIWRWTRTRWPLMTKLPGIRAPRTPADRQVAAPQDLASDSAEPPDAITDQPPET